MCALGSEQAGKKYLLALVSQFPAHSLNPAAPVRPQIDIRLRLYPEGTFAWPISRLFLTISTSNGELPAPSLSNFGSLRGHAAGGHLYDRFGFLPLSPILFDADPSVPGLQPGVISPLKASYSVTPGPGRIRDGPATKEDYRLWSILFLDDGLLITSRKGSHIRRLIISPYCLMLKKDWATRKKTPPLFVLYPRSAKVRFGSRQCMYVVSCTARQAGNAR